MGRPRRSVRHDVVMPRLFVAIDLPGEAKDRLERLCNGVKGARWTKDRQFHLTLRFIGEVEDTVAILVIVVLNAVVGAVQEFRAERAVAALKKMGAPVASVVRGGKLAPVLSFDVVPGDVVLLEAGNMLPADLRLFDVEEMEADESALTGESLPVAKSVYQGGWGTWELAARYSSLDLTDGPVDGGDLDVYTLGLNLSCCTDPNAPDCETGIPSVSVPGGVVYLNGVACE